MRMRSAIALDRKLLCAREPTVGKSVVTPARAACSFGTLKEPCIGLMGGDLTILNACIFGAGVAAVLVCLLCCFPAVVLLPCGGHIMLARMCACVKGDSGLSVVVSTMLECGSPLESETSLSPEISPMEASDESAIPCTSGS